MKLHDIFIFEEEHLNEIDMSPSSLKRLAANIDARAGMEFEMIVPDAGDIDLEPEWEPDYDRDQRARSFEDVEEFFFDGDYNGRGDVRRLLSDLGDAYMEWKMDRTANDWGDEGLDFMRDYIENNDLFDRDSALDTARDEIISANPDLPPESEDFQQLINTRVNELQEEFVMEQFENTNGRIYNDAFEIFADEKNQDYDESDFFEETHPYMTDILRNYDINWPYYYDLNDSHGGEADVERVAKDFGKYLNKKVNFSKSYHGGKREPGAYVVEPDGSLEGDNPGDAGLEFVSPPLPLGELMADLIAVKEWAENNGCYTNESTGLHINISVPGLKGVAENLDYVKLALLMGDNYVLEQFNRQGNTYTKSALDIVKKRVSQRPEDAQALLQQMRGHLNDLASKVIHSGITDKYTSINTKTGYVEFRSPGGDWLGENFDKIVNTLLRFVVALDAAIDPNKYRQEYLKKLYAILKPKSREDVMTYFAQFAAGQLPKQALKSFVRQAQLERQASKDPTGGKKYWWNVQWDANRRIEVVAGSKKVAIQVAAEEWGVPEERIAAGATVTPLRPYEEPTPQTGNWGVWIPSLNAFGTTSGQTRRYPSRAEAEAYVERYYQYNPGNDLNLEVREIESSTVQPTPAPSEWNIQNAAGTTVGQVTARTQVGAHEAARRYLLNLNPSVNTDEFRVVPAGQSPAFVDTTTDNRRGDLTPRGPGPWEIYKLSDETAIRDLENTNRQAAESEARSALGLRGLDPVEFGVRTRQRTGQETFTGEWDVVMGGEVVFRVPGENQSIANQAARQWVLGRSPEFLRAHQGQELEVVPRYQ